MRKLLLASSGLVNKSIVKALEGLLGKPAEGTRLAFVPTAANVQDGEKHWMIDDLNNCRQAGFEVDIVDVSAMPKDLWLPRLKESRVLMFGGGNTFHLMHWITKSGLADLLPELLESRVYAGISAGSIITGPTIYNAVQNLIGEKYELEIKKGLGWVNFQFIPHLNSVYFEKLRKKNLEIAAKEMDEPVYALDDKSALAVNGDQIEVISEGEWYKFG